MKTKTWRIYSDFLRCQSREEAEAVLRRAADGSTDHVLRLSYHFARSFGKMPDEYHNMVILIGGKLAEKYLAALEGKETS